MARLPLNEELAVVLEGLFATEGDAALPWWQRGEALLRRMGVPAAEVAAVVEAKDAVKFGEVARRAAGGGVPVAPAPGARAFLPSMSDGRTVGQARAALAASGGFDSLDEHNLKRALRAFRAKLKATRLDDESRLGSKYVTAGRSSSITAIEPPREYPAAVWEKLVELKRLNKSGRGLYELPEDAARR